MYGTHPLHPTKFFQNYSNFTVNGTNRFFIFPCCSFKIPCSFSLQNTTSRNTLFLVSSDLLFSRWPSSPPSVLDPPCPALVLEQAGCMSHCCTLCAHLPVPFALNPHSTSDRNISMTVLLHSVLLKRMQRKSVTRDQTKIPVP